MPSSSHFLCLGLHRRWIASYEVDYRQEAEWALARFDEQFPRASRRRSKPLDGGAAYEERFLISDEGGGWDVGVIFRLSRVGQGADYGNFVQFVGLRPRAWLSRCICMRSVAHGPAKEEVYDFELPYWRAIRMAFDDLERLMRWRRARIVRRRLALAMALHGRLGAASPLAGLGLDLVQRVADTLGVFG